MPVDSGGKPGRLFFFGLFALLIFGTLLLIRPFIGIILIALITVVLLRPLHAWILKIGLIKGRSWLATSLTLLGLLLLIVIPLILIGSLIFTELADFFEYLASEDLEVKLTDLLSQAEDFFQDIPLLRNLEINEATVTIFLQESASAILTILTDFAIGLAQSLPSLFIGAIIFLVLVASLLPAFDNVRKAVEEISPLDESISELYLHKSEVMIVSVIKGVFLLAILQGLIMGLFYWLAGIPFAWFWTILSMVFAILPVVGISFIVLPMAILSILSGNVLAAVLVLIGFYVFVNPLDIILRPKLVSEEAYLNFTLMLLALFGGIQLAGLIGMIYGPVIMILLLTTIDIYTKHYSPNAGQNGDETPHETVESGLDKEDSATQDSPIPSA